jgi:hypothetical protein
LKPRHERPGDLFRLVQGGQVTGAGDHDQARPWDAPGDLGRQLGWRLAMAAMVSSRVLPAIVTGPCRHSAGSCWLNSRGELVAKLFAEYYEPVRVEDVVHVDATT